MTRETIIAEMGKLNNSQRNAMRAIVCSNLDRLTVEAIGWKTRIRCDSLGFRYTIDMGPRGMILSRFIRNI